LNKAIAMKSSDTPMDEINSMRRNLINVYVIQEKYLEAAVLSEYIAEQFSNLPGADKVAVQGVKLYQQLYFDEKQKGQDATIYAERLKRLSDYILTRWAGLDVAGEVQLMQINTAIDRKAFAEAKKLIAAVAADVPQKMTAEIRLGQFLYNEYILQNRLPEDSGERLSKAKQNELLAEAKKYLESGLNGKIKQIAAKKEQADASSVQSAMALGQIELNAGKYEKAIAWFNDTQTGPLTVAKKPPKTISTDIMNTLQMNALMGVLRANVANEDINSAEETMNELEAVIKKQNADEQKLTQIYVAMGRQLENRLKELRNANEEVQAEKIADGFEKFLDRIAARKENTFQSLYWVADTFYRLGSGVSTDDKVSDEAVKYFTKAEKTYVSILKTMKDKPDFAPERANATIQIRLAESRRCIASANPDKKKRFAYFETAMKQLVETLNEAENRLDIQVEAAKMLEAWGKDDRQKVLVAVAGEFPTKKVWGWNGIIKRTSTNLEKFAESFYEAHLNKLNCVVILAKEESDKKKKEKLLDNSIHSLIALLQFHPDLGGEEWYPEFDKVCKNIERIQGTVKPDGIKGLLAKMNEAAPIAAVEPVQESDKTVAEGENPPKKTKKKSGKKTQSSSLPLLFGIIVAVGVPAAGIFLFIRNKEKQRKSKKTSRIR
jgi:hypothetical protein